MSTELSTQEQNQQLVFKELGTKITAVLSSDINNIENSLVVANAIGYMQQALTPEIMAPIMNLQGSKLGFRTDRDLVKNQQTGKYEKGPGYPLDVVKNCFIEMSLIGLLPTNNMWNIIGGNSYPTREGATYLLKKTKGLKQAISFLEVNQSADKKTASVKSKIKWEFNGESKEEIIEFPIKSDAYTTYDALIGKAERKAKMWLYNQVSGLDLADGDVDEQRPLEINTKPNSDEVSENKEQARVVNHIENVSKDIATLEKCSSAIKKTDSELIALYVRKHISLSTSFEELNSCKFVPSAEDDYDLFIEFSDKQKELKGKK